MKKILFLSVMCGSLFANNWVEVSHRSDGETLNYNKASIHETSPNMISVRTGSTYANGSVVERDTRLNCVDHTRAYGMAEFRFPSGAENKMDMSKHGWVFANGSDKAEKKLIKTICGQLHKK